MSRRLAITKRISLEGIADGWTAECFALVMPATYPEYIAISDAEETMKKTEVAAKNIEFVKAHIVSGRVMVLDDDGSLVLGDLLLDDVDSFTELANKLYLELMGVTADPKDLPPETPTATNTLPISPPSTEQ